MDGAAHPEPAAQPSDPRRRSLARVPPSQVMRFAPRYFDLLSKACEWSGGRFEPHATLKACAEEDARLQLWIFGERGGGVEPSIDAIAVTAINSYLTGMKTLEVILVGGQGARDWLPFEDDLAAFALSQGCSRLECFGRRGWAKTLPHWRPSYQLFERVITPGPEDGSDQGGGDG